MIYNVNSNHRLIGLGTDIFFLIFMVLAPIIQISNDNSGYWVNTLPIMNNEIILFNRMIFIFLTSNLIFSKIHLFVHNEKNIEITYDEKSLKYIQIIMYGTFLMSIFLTLPLIINMYVGNRGNQSIQESQGNIMMLVTRSIYFFPIPLFILKISDFRKTRQIGDFLLCMLYFLSIIFIINPIIQKRNLIGPVYLAFVLYFINMQTKEKNKISSLFLYMLGVSTGVLFPLLQSFTRHSGLETGKTLIQQNFSLIEAFSGLDYDAYANGIADIHFVISNGISYGYDLLGAVLFFVPRSIWTTKPVTGGHQIGEYLMQNYSMWFTNLSNPFVGESIKNFGFMGPIIFAFLYEVVSRKISKIKDQNALNNFAYFYFATFTIFFLRGDLMNGIAYGSGMAFALYLVPRIIKSLFNVNKGKA